MEKEKVYFPCYGRCEFGSLQEAVHYVQKMPGGLYVYIDMIVLYNIRFRDCLRAKGLDGVIRMLIDEAPEIAKEDKALDDLRLKWTSKMNERIADYDIQCLPKDSLINIDGYWFNGLSDIKAKTEISGNLSYYYRKWYVREENMQNQGCILGISVRVIQRLILMIQATIAITTIMFSLRNRLLRN